MLESLKLAFRNIFRHRRRSLLTGLAMGIGAFMLVCGQAYGDGLRRQLVEGMILANTGHIEIAPRRTTKEGGSFEESMGGVTDWSSVIADPDAIESRLLRETNIRTVSRRVVIDGMAISATAMAPICVIGIEPAKERDLFAKVAPAERGEALGGGPGGIYLSHHLAESFRVDVGDSLTVIAQTVGGGSNAMDFLVQGVFKRGAPWMDGNAYIDLADAQRLAMLDRGVSRIRVLLHRPERAEEDAAALQCALAERFGVEVKDWERAGGFFSGVALAATLVMAIVWWILLLVIAVGVMNTMLMAVHERTREIGTMLAMGASRRRIAALFLLEGLFLGLLAAGIGVALGFLLSLFLGKVGIPAPMEAARYAFGGDRAYPHPTLAGAAISYAVVVFLAAAASLYPALTASRLRPVEALAHV